MLDPLHIRQEALPGDHYVVLRGGSRTFDLDHVRDHAAEMFDRHGILGLSVFVVPRDHLEELFVHHEVVSRWVGKPVMVSRIRILHQAGFATVATDEYPHYDVVLAELSEPLVARLRGCFTDPQAGPPRNLPE